MNIIPVKLVGGCMRPLLKNGDCVFVVKTKDVRLGDIILFELEDKNFLHRVVKVLKNGYVVLDDFGITQKIFVPKENVVGKYPTIFSGYLGLVYHIIVKNTFLVLRYFKNFL